MKPKNCFKCSNKLIFLESSDSYTCKHCRAIEPNKKSKIYSKKNSKIEICLEIIPIKIEIKNWQVKTQLNEDIIEKANLNLIIDSLKDIINLATRIEKSETIDYTVVFSNETRSNLSCTIQELPLQLIIWSWRIKEKKTEKDYVTFGINFASLERNTFVSNTIIDKSLKLYAKSIGASDKAIEINQLKQIKLIKFLKSEIFRYFFEEKNDMVLPEETSEGIKIPSKANERLNIFIGLGILIFIFGGCVSSIIFSEPAYNSRSGINFNNPQYVDSVIERSKVGGTIDSVEEIVNTCKVMARDRGMSKSQAKNYCS